MTLLKNKLAVKKNITSHNRNTFQVTLDLKAKTNLSNLQLQFNFPFTVVDVNGGSVRKDLGNDYYLKPFGSFSPNQTKRVTLTVKSDNRKPFAPVFYDWIQYQPNVSSSNTQQKPSSLNLPDNSSSIPETGTSENNLDSSGSDIEPSDDNVNKPKKGKFSYGEALQKSFLFFEANRSGDLGKDNRIEWRGDSALNDGKDVSLDLTGGYYDAGDHVKFGLPMTANNTILAWGGLEYRQAYKKTGQWDELLEAVKWGTDYFLKTHVSKDGKTKELYAQVADGHADHAYWGSPEKMTMNRPTFKVSSSKPGTEVAAQTASALASASMLFRSSNEGYANVLLSNAKQLFEFADTYKGKYSDSLPQAKPFYTSVNGYWDELTEAAAWLNKATGDKKYLTKAEDYFNTKIGNLGDWSWAADDKSYAAAVLLAQQSDNPRYQNEIERWADRWINGEGAIKYSSGGLAFRTRWGSLALSSSASYLIKLFNDTVKEDPRYSKFATRQIDYILGDNPRKSSYMIGFGNNYPQQPHHRATSGNAPYGQPSQHILFGAMVGGPGSTNDFDYNDNRNDWVTNEVATGYNAPLTSALIQQYNDLGGDPLTEAQLDALPGIDANGVGF